LNVGHQDILGISDRGVRLYHFLEGSSRQRNGDG